MSGLTRYNVCLFTAFVAGERQDKLAWIVKKKEITEGDWLDAKWLADGLKIKDEELEKYCGADTKDALKVTDKILEAVEKRDPDKIFELINKHDVEIHYAIDGAKTPCESVKVYANE